VSMVRSERPGALADSHKAAAARLV
jgi:hypothetical protein